MAISRPKTLGGAATLLAAGLVALGLSGPTPAAGSCRIFFDEEAITATGVVTKVSRATADFDFDVLNVDFGLCPAEAKKYGPLVAVVDVEKHLKFSAMRAWKHHHGQRHGVEGGGRRR